MVGGLVAGAGIGFLFYFEEQPREHRRVTVILGLYGVLLLGVGVLRAVGSPG